MCFQCYKQWILSENCIVAFTKLWILLRDLSYVSHWYLNLKWFYWNSWRDKCHFAICNIARIFARTSPSKWLREWDIHAIATETRGNKWANCCLRQRIWEALDSSETFHLISTPSRRNNWDVKVIYMSSDSTNKPQAEQHPHCLQHKKSPS